jgi:phosphoribosylpyrophosphate synthetase
MSPVIKDYVGASLVGKTVIMPDDLIDTADTTIKGADYALKNEGAKEVLIFGTHAVFSAQKDAYGRLLTAEEKLARSGHRVLVTNSIPRDDAYYEKHRAWLTCLPIEPVMIKIIPQALLAGGSVSGVQ